MGCEGKFIGSLILSPGGSSSVYTPPKRRGGGAAIVSFEVLEFATNGAVLELNFQHRNNDETTWTTLGTFSSISASGMYSQKFSGIKQNVRTEAHLGVGSAQGDYALIDNIQESWLPY